MKKKAVRYLAGAAALAPAAMGLEMLAPAAAHAATTGCVGHNEFYFKKVFANPGPLFSQSVGVKGHGWYTWEPNGKICIGTVYVSTYTSTTGKDWPELGAFGHIYSKKVSGTSGNWVHAAFGVHKSQSQGVTLNAWSGYYGSIGTTCTWGLPTGTAPTCNTFG